MKTLEDPQNSLFSLHALAQKCSSHARRARVLRALESASVHAHSPLGLPISCLVDRDGMYACVIIRYFKSGDTAVRPFVRSSVLSDLSP